MFAALARLDQCLNAPTLKPAPSPAAVQAN
jgi:hypothetical protein